MLQRRSQGDGDQPEPPPGTGPTIDRRRNRNDSPSVDAITIHPAVCRLLACRVPVGAAERAREHESAGKPHQGQCTQLPGKQARCKPDAFSGPLSVEQGRRDRTGPLRLDRPWCHQTGIATVGGSARCISGTAVPLRA